MSNYTWLNVNSSFHDGNFTKPKTILNDHSTAAEITAIYLCHGFLGCVGFLENIAVIFVISHNRVMLDFPSNWFVLCLALTDAVTCLTTILLVYIILTGRTVFILQILYRFVIFASAGNLFILTFNRFLSVYDSLRYPARMTTSRAKRLALLPWIFAFIFSSSSAFSIATKLVNTTFLVGAYYYTLISSIVAMNIYMLKTAREKCKRIKRLENAVLSPERKSSVKEYRLVARLLIVSLTFFGSIIPFLVLPMVYQSTQSRQSSSFQRKFFWCIVATLLNAIIDPFVYSKNHPIFQRYFNRVRNRIRRRKVVIPRVFFLRDNEEVQIHFERTP